MTRRNRALLKCVGAICAGVLLMPGLVWAVTELPWVCDSSREIAVVAGESVDFPRLGSAQSGFSVLEERGAEWQYAQEAGSWRPVAFPGPRLGFLIQSTGLGASGRLPELRPAAGATGGAKYGTTCRWRDGVDPDWFASAQMLSETVDPSIAGSVTDMAPFEALVATATHPFQLAAAMHLRANAKYRAGDNLGSVADFDAVAKRWLALGDRERAGAALLGKADLLRLIGLYLESRDAAIEALPMLDTEATRFFRLRAKEAVCHSHHWMKELDFAAECLRTLPGEYLAIGEVDGFFNAATLTLNLQRDRGVNLDRATLDPALLRALGSDAVDPMRKGRLELTLAMALRDQGDVSAALRGFDAALDHFSRATEDRERWQANALLNVSGLYAELGMFDQAYQTHRDALHGFNPRSAPARVASALKWLSEIDRHAGDQQRALLWADKSIAILAALKVPAELAISRLTRLELRADLGTGEADAEAQLARITPDLTEPYQPRASLLAARLKLNSKQKRTGLGGLAVFREPTQPLSVQHEATLHSARVLVADSQPENAFAVLQDQVQRTTTLASVSGNPGLAYLMTRSLSRVRQQIAALGLNKTFSDQRPDELWRALLTSQALGAYRAGAERSESDLKFSAELSRRLMYGGGEWSRSAETLLLERLSGAKSAGNAVSAPNLANTQAMLAKGDMLLVVVPAEPESLMWLVASDTHQRIALPGRKALQQSIAALLRQLGDRKSSMPALNQSVHALSTSLLGGIDAQPVPKRLWILYDESIADIPWNTLRWPGSAASLVETTGVSWITRIEHATVENAERRRDRRLEIVIADPGQTAGSAVAALPQAQGEAGLVHHSVPDTHATVIDGAQATPENLRASLRRNGTMVHLAAHGYARPGLLGYAGVWLAARAGSMEPQFLSWLDLADTPLEADLAVLNACQLAAGPGTASAASLSFAGAVSAAGVDQVVAALWPLSDAATVRWVPAFYRALDDADLNSSAEALRQAQLELRASRHFRHPFYWASLVHFRHLKVTADAPN